MSKALHVRRFKAHNGHAGAFTGIVKEEDVCLGLDYT